MRTRVRVAAAMLVFVGVTTACQRTTEGSVAMTTEPGPPLTSPAPTAMPSIPGLPDFEIPGLPLPTRDTDVPVVPPPPNAVSMTCEEFNGLDEATRLAVIRAILEQENNPLGPNGEGIGQMLAEAACQFLPSATVSEILLGKPPP
ncbi:MULTISPECIES: hypothetical protein [unclassified Mycobacterium]|uniref:hypothetical protein n=1 Tax=unclassified Mycobacterium TaxID=2642494 RepID=UPI00074046FE|nr:MULTISPECIES: hypothetical protein [unclassified Mycobacterium]KUH85851.1 hypothetical protein AU186_24370 [Mycobacterium sp. GA-1999]KUH91707.1 hypothetical protein AU185_11435 [Mycobacterium sp. GA-0227b]KUH96054.1 hypothetical protein AU187_12495 [Mycobacterium sp. IS-1556]